MDKLNTTEEILRYAIGRENQSYKFYLDWAEQVKHLLLREALESFAREELRHKALLELEIMKLGKVVADAEDLGEAQEIDHLVLPQEFDTEADVLKFFLQADVENIFMQAMDREKASFQVYTELAVNIGDEGMRQTFLSLAEEEVKHRVWFEIEYDKLMKRKSNR
jgi:rubrerythrin